MPCAAEPGCVCDVRIRIENRFRSWTCLGAHFAGSAPPGGALVRVNARVNGVPARGRARHNRGHGIVTLAAG